MRIAFVIGSFPRLSETFIIDQIAGLIDRGHEVEVLAHKPLGKLPANEKVSTYRMLDKTRYYLRTWSTPTDIVRRTMRLAMRDPLGTMRMMAGSLDAVRAFHPLVTFGTWPLASLTRGSRPYDVALAHFGGNGALAERVRALGALRAPLVTSFLGRDLSALLDSRGASFYRRLVERGELMLPCSRLFAHRLVEIGCAPERVRVHRMGVDLASFEMRTRTREPDEKTCVLSVVRLVEKKGVEFGLRAMARVVPRQVNLHWDIIGDDGPLRARLDRLIVELGLTSHVTLHSPLSRDGVRAMLGKAHLFLAPSVTASDGDQEGVPVAIVEAMACGLPVVSTLHSGIPELVADGETGYLVPERDVAALADRLLRLIDEPERWPAMGQRGRQIVQAEYDVRQLNASLCDILADVAEKHAESRREFGEE